MLEARGGKVAGVVAAVAAIGLLAYSLAGYLHGDTPTDARERMYVCTETGKPFRHESVIGETLPVRSPHSGKNTGMPAEACYWTAAGIPKDYPTWVLLNEFANKPGPTFCPDCGRLVVGHNPPAAAGGKPPPTQAEYRPRKPASSRGDR